MGMGSKEYDLGITSTQNFNGATGFACKNGEYITPEEALELLAKFHHTTHPGGHGVASLAGMSEEGEPVYDYEFVPNGKHAVVCDRSQMEFYQGSDGFTPPQYIDYFSEILDLGKSFGCEIATVGTLGNGAKAFVSLTMPSGDINLDGYSKVISHGNFGLGIDGKTSLMASESVNVVACLNSFMAELVGGSTIWKIRNTTFAADRLASAQRHLENVFSQKAGIGVAIERLIEEAFPRRDFVKMASHLVSDGKGRPEESGRGQTTHDKRVEAMIERYNAPDLEPIQDSVWAAFMAAQSYEQHAMPSRAQTAGSRAADRAIFGVKSPITTGAAEYLNIASLIAV